jgi:hypothetical protein
MNVQGQIKEYIASQTEPRLSDMQALHRIILEVMPACKLWFRMVKTVKIKLFLILT